ncbi:hypothetical protein D3C87_654300 [compost metagenome]
MSGKNAISFQSISITIRARHSFSKEQFKYFKFIMTKRIIIFILFLPFIINAQTNLKINLNDLVSDFIKTQKTDTLFTYETYSTGSIPIVELSENEGEICIADLTNHPIYVFWKEKDKTYFSKLGYCDEYSKIILQDDSFWETYFSNKALIEHEIIKPFEYVTIQKSKKIKHTMARSHSSFQNLRIIIKGNITEKRFDDFDLQKEDGNFININYKNNINLKSKLIVDILEKITSEAEKNNIFKKIKSR